MKQFLRLYRDGEAEKSEFPIILNPTPSQVHPVKGVNTDMHGNQPLQVGNTTQGEEGIILIRTIKDSESDGRFYKKDEEYRVTNTGTDYKMFDSVGDLGYHFYIPYENCTVLSTPTTQSEGEEKKYTQSEFDTLQGLTQQWINAAQSAKSELQALRLSNEQGDKLVIELQGNLDDQKVKIIQLEKELEELRAIRKMIPDGIWNAWKRVYSSEKELKDLKENGFSENYPDGEDFHDD